jgi:hypothetical protein
VRGRKPASELVEALDFPEAIANELTLRRALGSLLERLLARPERAGRPFRKLALVARLVDGGSWRRVATLRDATAEVRSAARGARAEAAGAPCADRRAPARAVELAEHTGQQLALVEPAGRRRSCACAKGCGRCVRARARDRCAQWWRLRRGREFRKRERWSYRGTISRSSQCAASRARGDGAGGTPRIVNREQVTLVREEWRVVDRWWTEEPIDRRYFEVVLEGGRNVCVYRDAERLCWFTQNA